MNLAKQVCLVVVICSAVGVLTWLLVGWVLSPRQRFVGDCSEIYNVADCEQRWEREHPMPDDYGKDR